MDGPRPWRHFESLKAVEVDKVIRIYCVIGHSICSRYWGEFLSKVAFLFTCFLHFYIRYVTFSYYFRTFFLLNYLPFSYYILHYKMFHKLLSKCWHMCSNVRSESKWVLEALFSHLLALKGWRSLMIYWVIPAKKDDFSNQRLC